MSSGSWIQFFNIGKESRLVVRDPGFWCGSAAAQDSPVASAADCAVLDQPLTGPVRSVVTKDAPEIQRGVRGAPHRCAEKTLSSAVPPGRSPPARQSLHPGWVRLAQRQLSKSGLCFTPTSFA